MDIDQLKSFISVAERLSFTEASKHLYISQPRLSLQIANLEKQLNVKLLHRNTHSVNLTPAGRVFLEGAKEIVNKYDDVILKTRQTDDGLVGKLELIYYVDSISVFLLPYLLKKFKQTYPHIGINPHQVKDEEFHKYLVSMKADIGIGIRDDNENEMGLENQFLCRDRFCLVVSSEHLLANHQSVSLSSLFDEHFIVFCREASFSYLPTIHRLCAKNGFIPKVNKEVHNTDILLICVEIGEGVALVPRTFSNVYKSPHLCYINVEEDDVAFDNILVWKDENQNPLIPLFINEMASFQMNSL